MPKNAIYLWIIMVCINPNFAWAHGDEVHSDEPIKGQVIGNDSSIKLSNDRVFMPKAVQRALSVRTVVSDLAQWPETRILNASIVANPNASGVVQASQNGRIDTLSNQPMPFIGDHVKKGQVLAYLQPNLSALEQATHNANIAELMAQQRLLGQRISRFEKYKDTIASQEIDELNIQRSALNLRLDALKQSFTKQALVAPVSGVISAAHIRAGQVVEAKELLFEIIQPQYLWIEAQLFDTQITSTIDSAKFIWGQQQFDLDYISTGIALKNQANTLYFALKAQKNNMNGLTIGQLGQVFVQTKNTEKGVAVAKDAIVENGQGQHFVWIHTQPEYFERKQVSFKALDGQRVLITQGLLGQERVVVQGAYLLSQVR